MFLGLTCNELHGDAALKNVLPRCDRNYECPPATADSERKTVLTMDSNKRSRKNNALENRKPWVPYMGPLDNRDTTKLDNIKLRYHYMTPNPPADIPDTKIYSWPSPCIRRDGLQDMEQERKCLERENQEGFWRLKQERRPLLYQCHALPPLCVCGYTDGTKKFIPSPPRPRAECRPCGRPLPQEPDFRKPSPHIMRVQDNSNAERFRSPIFTIVKNVARQEAFNNPRERAQKLAREDICRRAGKRKFPPKCPSCNQLFCCSSGPKCVKCCQLPKPPKCPNCCVVKERVVCYKDPCNPCDPCNPRDGVCEVICKEKIYCPPYCSPEKGKQIYEKSEIKERRVCDIFAPQPPYKPIYIPVSKPIYIPVYKPACKPVCKIMCEPVCEPVCKTDRTPMCSPCSPMYLPSCSPYEPMCQPVFKTVYGPCGPVCEPVCKPACQPMYKPVCQSMCQPTCQPVWSPAGICNSMCSAGVTMDGRGPQYYSCCY